MPADDFPSSDATSSFPPPPLSVNQRIGGDQTMPAKRKKKRKRKRVSKSDDFPSSNATSSSPPQPLSTNQGSERDQTTMPAKRKRKKRKRVSKADATSSSPPQPLSTNQEIGRDQTIPAKRKKKKRKRVSKADDFAGSNPSLKTRPSDSDEHSSPRQREIESRGAGSSPAIRGGRNSPLKNGQSQGDGSSQKEVKDFGVPNNQKSCLDDDVNEEEEEEEDEDSDKKASEDVILLYKPKGVNLLNKLANRNAAPPKPKVSAEQKASEDLSLLNELANRNAALPKPKVSDEQKVSEDLSLLNELANRNAALPKPKVSAEQKASGDLSLLNELANRNAALPKPKVSAEQKASEDLRLLNELANRNAAPPKPKVSAKQKASKDLSLLNELAPKPKVSAEQNPSFMSKTRSAQCSVSPLSLKGIKDVGYEHMTIVQKTLPVFLKGKDVLVKATTGTEKTVAFLLPAIEMIVQSPSVDCDQKCAPIYVLVICPTQELARQAAIEADTLLKYHPTIGVQVVTRGTKLSTEQERLQANPCQILIATPERLRDHAENTAGFVIRLMGLKVLVLDEADQILDMGFRKDIERIVTLVPRHRQTLLFSATVLPQVFEVCRIALKKDHKYINTVEKGSQKTCLQLKQMHIVAPVDKHFSLLYTLLKEHIADDVDYKVIVFCTTAMITRLVANLLSELKMNVCEINYGNNSKYKTNIFDEFWKSKGLILVTYDVFARGVDYPDATLVIQLGMASDKALYMERLGGTGQIGTVGKGIILLGPYEESFLSNLKNIQITKASEPSVDPETRKEVEEALSRVDMKNKKAAYQAWIEFYHAKNRILKNHDLVEHANEFSRSMGLDNPPAIPNGVVVNLGLQNEPGLVVEYYQAYNKAPKQKQKQKLTQNRNDPDFIQKQINEYKCFQRPRLLWPGAASFMAGITPCLSDEGIP